MRAGVAMLLIIGGVLGIVLPVLGFWMVPLGLALLAIDVPFSARAVCAVTCLHQPKAHLAGRLTSDTAAFDFP